MIKRARDPRITTAQVPEGLSSPDLEPELQAVLQRVGPGQYGYATAREFVVGKYSGRSTRPRLARR